MRTGQKINQTIKYLAIAALLSAGSPELALANPAHPDAGQKEFEILQNHIVDVSDSIKNAVVHIEVLSKRGEKFGKGVGSGVIISPEGQIVTNYHVIDRAQVITVILDDKSKYEAEVWRTDQRTDLAILKVKADKPLPTAPLAETDNVRVGQWVLAVGNPYGFDRTVSFGIISGKGRYIPGVDNGVSVVNDFIQTDALIEPGNSGGPLVDMQGRVIGINSVGMGRGQGFTTPVKIVREIMSRSEDKGRIRRGYLGAFLQPFTEEYAKYLGKPDMRGILVGDVMPEGPAAKSGLRSGDIITTFDSHEIAVTNIEAVNSFIMMVIDAEPDTKVPVTVYRQGKELPLIVTLGTQPDAEPKEFKSDTGISLVEITQTIAAELRIDRYKGVLITEVVDGSPAEQAGLLSKDIVLKVDDTTIENLDDMKAAMKKVEKNNAFMVVVKRGPILYYALVDMEPFRDSK